ncbi:choline dehydrogenase mitochondrial precursor [Xylariaceae sp. FL0255]|nr:choline dehydrogenase mitochondrial precursor [Xylariaceae sp. FL0255]
MRSFTQLALFSAAASFVKADVDFDTYVQYINGSGTNILLPRVQPNIPFDQLSDAYLRAHEPTKEEYEYIVIGSGAGGSPIAANLARAGHSVLLVEAGGDYGHLPEVVAPALDNSASERNEVSWGFFTRHYENTTMALQDRKITYRSEDDTQYYTGINPPEGFKLAGNFYPRYSGLGGCTEHNALVGMLPANSDWDDLAAQLNDDSWSAANMRKYFEKIENLQYDAPDKEGHGFDGYVDFSWDPLGIAAQDVKFVNALIGAARGWGLDVTEAVNALNTTMEAVITSKLVDPYTELLPLNMTQSIDSALNNLLMPDLNEDTPNRDKIRAFGRLPLMMSNQQRRSSPRDYVYNTATAKNKDGSQKYPLEVALNTLVTKVTFTQSKCASGKPQANGIEYLYGENLYRASPLANLTEDGGKPGSVRATKEVIVSGGAFNSPQILKLSGVGPKEELEKWNIPVIADVPTGTNLQDRLEVGVDANYPSNFSRILPCYYLATPESEDPCWQQYIAPGATGAEKGTYASGLVYTASFWASSYSENGDQDLWIGGFPAIFTGFYPGYSSYAATANDKTHWSWLILKAHTRNHAGTVKLTSTNPRDVPEIIFHSMYEGMPKEDADKDTYALVEGMRMALNFFGNTTDVDGLPTIWWPNSVENAYEATDDELHEWIKQEAWGHHASCSNPLGADNDPKAVLDTNFKVRGVDGLRVVDTSVFPRIPGTFITLPTLMISEKAADVILQGK